MGPLVLIDKSFLENLSYKEVIFLQKHYSVIITPILLKELLVDLSKVRIKSKISSSERVAMLARRVNDIDIEEIQKEPLKISMSKILSDNFNVKKSIGEIIIQNNDFSFQDMKSIHRAYKKYFKIEIIQDEVVNNIILAQACRHVIVHTDGKVNGRLINQLKNANQRSLKPDINKGESLNFSNEELELIINNMERYFDGIVEKLIKYY